MLLIPSYNSSNMKPYIWDYDLPEGWEPKTEEEWAWYLVRKINYDDLAGVTNVLLKKYFPLLDKELDPGKRILLKYYLTGKGI